MTVVVDTSALIAILFNEPERQSFRHLLLSVKPVISAGTVVELIRVVMRREPQHRPRLMRLLDLLAIEIVATDKEQVLIAEDAAYRFGKGRGAPPAVLNFGDLFAYALARKLEAPLLFKGDDFAQTDVTPAVA